MNFSARAAAIAFVAVAAVPLGCAAPRHGISVDGNRVRVAGPAAGEGTLCVGVAGSPVSMFGEILAERDQLTFVPRFPFSPGVEYLAVFQSPAGEKVKKLFRIPTPPPSAPTFVRAVFPSRDTLPENLLKFYLHFSAPMSRREAYRRVHLRQSSGREVELPFLELGEELWDRSGMRLTLLFDPGRIKRGLKPREDSGPALEEGKSYTLVVDRDWPDAEGQPLREGFRKAFQVSAPDDRQPDPKAWTLVPPRTDTTEPLSVTLDEPLDEAMLNRSLVVVDAAEKTVEGRVEIDRGETRWRFHPGAAWKAGKYTLVVDTVLEDMAGNSIERPFEVDVARPVERKVSARTIRLPFEPSH
jgi:hypothetical protein